MQDKDPTHLADYAANHAFGQLANEARLFALRGRLLGDVTRVFDFDRLFKMACQVYQGQHGHYIDGSMDPLTFEEESEVYISLHMLAGPWRARFYINGNNEKEVAITIVSPFTSRHERSSK